MTSDPTVELAEHVRRNTRWAGFVVGGFVATLLVAMLVLVNDSRNQTARLTDLLMIVERPLVESWALEPLFTTAQVDGDPMMFAGELVCSAEAIEMAPLIQFESVIIAGDVGVPSLIRSMQLPVSATRVCGNGRVEFPVPWSQVSGGEAVEAPSEYRLVISAVANGFVGDRATSTPFTITPP